MKTCNHTLTSPVTIYQHHTDNRRLKFLFLLIKLLTLLIFKYHTMTGCSWMWLWLAVRPADLTACSKDTARIGDLLNVHCSLIQTTHFIFQCLWVYFCVSAIRQKKKKNKFKKEKQNICMWCNRHHRVKIRPAIFFS